VANFIECNREQQYLLPPALQDWLPPKDLAWLIIDAVDAMDLSAFYKKYREDGQGRGAQEWTLICTTHNLLKLWRSGRGILPLAVS